MDTKQLKTFVVLAKEKNYIKASEILNYAPSTLAKHIHALEAEFSTTFVHFRNGAICLTKDGEIFLPYAKEMLKMYDKCEATFKQEHRENKIIVAGGELICTSIKRKLNLPVLKSIQSVVQEYLSGWNSRNVILDMFKWLI